MNKPAIAVCAVLALVATGCVLPSPQYDHTAFSCEEPGDTCPDGFECVNSVCVNLAGEGAPDAGPVDDDPPDADTSIDDLPDAAVAPDAAMPVTQTLTFGERADSDVTDVTEDTFIREDLPNDTHGGNNNVAVDADPRKRGLLKFDVSAIPADAVVLSAQLEIYINDPIESGEMELTRMLQSWNEDEATWLNRNAGQTWLTEGAGLGTFDPTVIGRLEARQTGSYAFPISAIAVQIWVSSPDNNNGMRWESTSLDGRGAEFDSGDSNNQTRRPVLIVTFQH